MHDFQRRRAAPCRNVSVSTDMLCGGFEGATVEQIFPELPGRHLLPQGARVEPAPQGSYEPPCSPTLFMAAPVDTVCRGNVAHLVWTSDRARRRCFPTQPIDTASRRICSVGALGSQPLSAKWPAGDAAHPQPRSSEAATETCFISVRHNVGVDRHAPARRRETYAPAHGLRRLAGACPRRTTC